MNIFNNVINGMTNQIGREFGRAAANSLLNGANHYNVKSNAKYNTRVTQKDNDVIRSIKEINRIKFTSNQKSNISKMIDIANIAIDGVDDRMSIDRLTDVLYLNKLYENKMEHGEALISDDYDGKDIDLLKSKIEEYETLVDNYVINCKNLIKKMQKITSANRKSKWKAAMLSFLGFFIMGFPFDKLYLERYDKWETIKFIIKNIIWCALFFWIRPIFPLFRMFKYVFTPQENLDKEYNVNYLYYKTFKL